MKISDIYTAKDLKFRLLTGKTHGELDGASIISVELTQEPCVFLVYPVRAASQGNVSPVVCRANEGTAEYIRDRDEAARTCGYRTIYVIENMSDDSAEVQAYIFGSFTESRTDIIIRLPQKMSGRKPELHRKYVTEQFGSPAIVIMQNECSGKRRGGLRLISGDHSLILEDGVYGLSAVNENYRGNQYGQCDIISAPAIRFVDEAQTGDRASSLPKLSSYSPYMENWKVYNELSRRLMMKESQSFGSVLYSSYTASSDINGITFTFAVKEPPDHTFMGASLYAGPGEEDEFREPVGSVISIRGKKLVTYLESDETFGYLPDAGALTLNNSGNRTVTMRREIARDRIESGNAQIKYLKQLIETGSSPYGNDNERGSAKPITNRLKREFPKAAQLNSDQETAVDIAINTPDIALIQGPPGTGKTTVIKAICLRFKEMFEKEERLLRERDPVHSLRSPKILISGFQNEAVDNAVHVPLSGEIPVYRKAGKRAGEASAERFREYIDKWREQVGKTVRENISDEAARRLNELRARLRDEYFEYISSDCDPVLAEKLAEHYMSIEGIDYPENLIRRLKAVLPTDNAAGEPPLPEDPFPAKVEALRTERVAYDDDGRVNVLKVLAYLKMRDEVSVEDETLNALKAVTDESFTDGDFDKYVEAARKLKKRFCPISAGADRKTVLNDCLLRMSECFNSKLINSLTDIESKRSLILSEFLSQLDDEYEYIVKKYSDSTAATCQSCLDTRRHSIEKYDLVIVDEAARANPLDLFIPMSMGSKVILVGDHKQLPHMLEQDVLDAISDDIDDAEILNVTLFERLFDMFSKGPHPRAIKLRQQYRMHPEICSFVSAAFYEGSLRTAPEVTAEDRKSPETINGGRALTFVDIPISRGAETQGRSKSRRAEAEAVSDDVRIILAADNNASVGIITFYSAQVELIDQMLETRLDSVELSRVKVGTVDAFQGREFDYVLLSCVRSNMPKTPDGQPEVGFLEKPNRICVALSRALRQLVVYGDHRTLKRVPCFDKLYKLCTQGGGTYREL